jgi:hypothetical protein
MCIYCRGGRFTRWLGFMLDVFKSALSLWWLLICPCLMMPTFLEYLSSTDLLLRCLSWRHFGTMLNITQHDTHVSITNPIDTGVLSFGRSLSNMQTCLIYLLFFLSQNAFMSFWFAISQVFWCWKMLSVFCHCQCPWNVFSLPFCFGFRYCFAFFSHLSVASASSSELHCLLHTPQATTR